MKERGVTYRVRAELRYFCLGYELLLDGRDELVTSGDRGQQRSLRLRQHTRHLALLHLPNTLNSTNRYYPTATGDIFNNCQTFQSI